MSVQTINRRLPEVVLFPFDDVSIPFTHALEVRLVAGEKYGPVVGLGRPGDPDADMVMYYGTTIRVGGEFRMWYMGREYAADESPHGPFRTCYAVSEDGIHWQKPALGLVEYNGTDQNNLVGLQAGDGGYGEFRTQSITVLYEPDDPDPNRRFKMYYQTSGGPHGAVAFSPDGLRWKDFVGNPVQTFIEQSGLVKFNGGYYVNGHHKEGPWDEPWNRRLHTFVSYDFEHWTQADNVGFCRFNPPMRHPRKREEHPLGEQNHMGASLWDRGNVIVGFYGMWHGGLYAYRDVLNPNRYDIRMITIDIGLVVTNDAIHYREPVPDAPIISAAMEPDGAFPALQQGQGFENVGDKTYVWYGVWDEWGWANKNNKASGGGLVRLATWNRDRLGYYEVVADGAHFISHPLLPENGDRVFVNADGLSEAGYLTLELLDGQLRPLSGYSGPDSAVLKTSGLREPAMWGDKTSLDGLDMPIRIRADYKGEQAANVRVYAVYVAPQ